MQYCLDLSSYACPIPLLMLKKAIQQLNSKEQLKVIMNKQNALENWQVFAKQNGGQLVSKKWLTDGNLEVIFTK